MAETFVAKVMPLPKLDLQSLFPLVDPAGIQLLESMLRFSPYERPSIQECLESPWFDPLRKNQTSKPAPSLFSDEQISIAELPELRAMLIALAGSLSNQ